MELKELKGVGEITLKKLNSLNINTLNDLVFTLPKSYIDYSLHSNYRESNILIHVTPITGIVNRTLRNKTSMQIFTALANNERVKMIAFGKKYIYSQIYKNQPVYVYGSYKDDYNYFLVEKIFLRLPNEIETEYGLKDLPDNTVRKLIYESFSHIDKPLERLPLNLVSKYKLLGYSDFLLKAHFPKSFNDIKEVKRRKTYEKFFWYNLALNYLKNRRDSITKPKRIFNRAKVLEFINGLPFTLTSDQKNAVKIILDEIASPKKVNRLVEGDVGCGKTIVAFIAAYALILAGFQVAFLAPTEILARQHYNKALALFKDIKIDLLVSKLTKKEKNTVLEDLALGKTKILIGTHAIIEDKVKFNNLGLIIIDEQQRFGVKERSRLQEDYPLADSLYFTATPIPRTLGLTMFGDLDLTMIRTLPSGRKKVTTKIVTEAKLDKMCEFINSRLELNEQIFIVVPLIEESEALGLWNIKAASEYFLAKLKGKIRTLHGRVKASDKTQIMEDFKNHEFDILLATTMIEVGIDIPNASVLVLMNAERFGLSSSHQLRGRIGRGSLDGYFFLVSNDINNKRLEILENTNDGFLLANEDFKLRGPGDYLGEKQSGYFSLINQADIDYELRVLECAKEDAKVEVEKIDKNNNLYIMEVLENLSEKIYENN